MPRYSVIVTITRDLVVEAKNERAARRIVDAELEHMRSADVPEVTDPVEVGEDYESETDDEVAT